MKRKPTFCKTFIVMFYCLINTTLLFSNNKDSSLTSLFDLSIEELIQQEVTIATKTSQKLSQTPSVVSVITAEEIKAMGFRELAELLSIIPGFQLSQNRSGVNIISIRGISDFRQGGRILVLLDGTPYNGVMYGSPVYFGAEIDMDVIEKVEIIRGPGSALYGRNAFSCVINIITKKADHDNQTELGASYGSFMTAGLYSSYQVKKPEFRSVITAKYYTTDRTNQTFDNGKGGEDVWNISHDNLYFNGNAQYNKFSFSGSYMYRMDGNTYGPFITNSNTSFSLGNYCLKYENNLTSNINLNIKLYGRNEHRIQNVVTYEPNTTAIHPLYGVPINALAPEGIYAKPVLDDYIYGIEIESNLQLFKNNKLLIGLQGDMHGVENASVRSNYNLRTGMPLYYPINDTTRQFTQANMPVYEPGWIIDGGHGYTNLAIYLQDIHYIFSSFGLTVGGRLDYDSETGIIFNPRLGAVWEINRFLSAKILYGQAFRAPTTSEQYKIVGNDWGNKDLNYEEIKTTELALNFNTGKTYSQASFYFNLLDNVILQQFIDTTNTVKSYFNAGKNESYGFDIENKFFINNNFHTFFNYSYNQSNDIVIINDTSYSMHHPNLARHHYIAGFGYRFTKNLSFNAWLRYQGEMVKFFAGGGPDEIEYISKDKVGDFYLLNASVIVRNVINGLDFSFYGYNLLNSKYYFQDDLYEHQPKQPPIHFLIRAAYRFN